ncbi:formate hydrogenlyase complex 3 iron-sulfur protein [Klebsiella michiganensis]|nr:formate hydrogenlyase complex 3 iron-sulfur protein [Klebsiella michiganensis]
MFTFIKKVIKTGTATHSYPLEPMPVDKNFRGKPEHNPQQCIGCAACVNACPSNALTVETDLATNQLAWAVQPRTLHLLRTLRRGLPDGGD